MATDFGFFPVTDGKHYFISYNTEDSARVAPIACALHEAGVPLWYDYGLEYGEEWERQIARNIHNAEAVIMFVTNELFQKKRSYVRKEYEIADLWQIKIVPVVLDSIIETSIPDYSIGWWLDIRAMHSVRCSADDDSQSIAKRIMFALGLSVQKEASVTHRLVKTEAGAQKNDRSSGGSDREDQLPTAPKKSSMLIRAGYSVETEAALREDAELSLKLRMQEDERFSEEREKEKPSPATMPAASKKTSKRIRTGYSAETETALREDAELSLKLRMQEDERFSEEGEKKPSPAAEPAAAKKPLRSVRLGEYISFGNYPQRDSKPEPIYWKVLSVEKGRALVISRYALDCVSYHEAYEGVTWGKCSLRSWLNSVFYEKAFDPDEQRRIVSAVNKNPTKSIGGIGGDNPTMDRIFCLSIDEAKRYFRYDEDRMCIATLYARKRMSYLGEDKHCWWWLRSPGNDLRNAACVSKTGALDIEGNGVFLDRLCVRPAMWIEL